MPVQKSSYHLTLCSCKNAYCFPGHYGLFIWWYILTMTLLTFQLPYLSVKYAQNFHFFTLFKFFCLVFLFLKNTNNSIIDKHLIFKAKLPNFRTIRFNGDMIVCFALPYNIYSDRNGKVEDFVTISVFINTLAIALQLSSFCIVVNINRSLSPKFEVTFIVN